MRPIFYECEFTSSHSPGSYRSKWNCDYHISLQLAINNENEELEINSLSAVIIGQSRWSSTEISPVRQNQEFLTIGGVLLCRRFNSEGRKRLLFLFSTPMFEFGWVLPIGLMIIFEACQLISVEYDTLVAYSIPMILTTEIPAAYYIMKLPLRLIYRNNLTCRAKTGLFLFIEKGLLT